jgi:hypothetical protein
LAHLAPAVGPVHSWCVSHHAALLRTVFQDPISANIHWREVESLLHHLGASVESLDGNRVRVKLNRAEAVLHRPHHGHTLDRNAVRALRAFLGGAGMTVSQYEASHDKPG